ncbi:MAG: hypothetical protein JRD68_03730, partial [Deltaproteobacteria bacterium]|nr:hypothetical protein [Deltaproteobacteria bacterium]
AAVGTMAILYYFVSGIFNLVTMHVEERDEQISNLVRRLTCFICDASLGRVSEQDLKRINNAAQRRSSESIKSDLSNDDFSLIANAWYFWKDHIGFDWQDETECVNCEFARKEHLSNGSCPPESLPEDKKRSIFKSKGG